MFTVLTTDYRSNKISNLITEIKNAFHQRNELVYLYVREFSNRPARHNSNEDCNVQNKLYPYIEHWLIYPNFEIRGEFGVNKI